jgi:hypothetical protein
MTKVERIDAVLAGRPPDRPPFFWHHFGPGATFGPEAVAAHVSHLETYDLDFLKVMDDNRYPRTFNRSATAPLPGFVLFLPGGRNRPPAAALSSSAYSFGRGTPRRPDPKHRSRLDLWRTEGGRLQSGTGIANGRF